MMNLTFASRPDPKLRILCLGAHGDDIEIGCGGTILRLIEENPATDIRWIVLAAAGPRKAEAIDSANVFLEGAQEKEIVTKEFKDGYFPHMWAGIKDFIEDFARHDHPDLR